MKFEPKARNMLEKTITPNPTLHQSERCISRRSDRRVLREQTGEGESAVKIMNDNRWVKTHTHTHSTLKCSVWNKNGIEAKDDNGVN